MDDIKSAREIAMEKVEKLGDDILISGYPLK